MGLKRSLVITSISAPNVVMRSCAAECAARGIDFIVIGDVSSPPEFHLPGCDYWGIERQQRLDSRLAAIAPQRHYARKNLGYLVAMRQGAGVISETDDDNHPGELFWQERSPEVEAHVVADAGWVNVYRHFSDNIIWPRGFPLELVQQPAALPADFDKATVFCPIQQGLADGNPDVDAIYRLLMPLPQIFLTRAPVALGRNSCCPFNSQNTTWFREAYPLLYLPATCSFRLTDIWRSFIAQRICHGNGWHVLFHSATVRQERNGHDLLRDFDDEVAGYLGNARLWELLLAVGVEPGPAALAGNLRRIYERLVVEGFFEGAELTLLDAWLADVEECCG